eukprot:9775295-Lingulodinium_polyedra.AAC.1
MQFWHVSGTMDRQAGKQAGRQASKQVGRQAGRQCVRVCRAVLPKPVWIRSHFGSNIAMSTDILHVPESLPQTPREKKNAM